MIVGDIMIDTNLWKTRIGGWLTKSWGESVRFFTTIFSALRPEGPKSQTGLTQTEKKIAEEQGSVAKTEAKKDKKTTVHEDMNDSVPW